MWDLNKTADISNTLTNEIKTKLNTEYHFLCEKIMNCVK